MAMRSPRQISGRDSQARRRELRPDPPLLRIKDAVFAEAVAVATEEMGERWDSDGILPVNTSDDAASYRTFAKLELDEARSPMTDLIHRIVRGQATATGRAEDDPDLLAQVALCAALQFGWGAFEEEIVTGLHEFGVDRDALREGLELSMRLGDVTATASTRVRSEAGVVAYLGFTSALLAIGIDTALPAFDEIREEFSLADGSGEVSLVVTAYFLGMAAGQLPMGPLSIGSVAVRYCSPRRALPDRRAEPRLRPRSASCSAPASCGARRRRSCRHRQRDRPRPLLRRPDGAGPVAHDGGLPHRPDDRPAARRDAPAHRRLAGRVPRRLRARTGRRRMDVPVRRDTSRRRADRSTRRQSVGRSARR